MSGVTVRDMTPEQRQLVADHMLKYAAPAEWWQAQAAAQRGDINASNSHMAASIGLRSQGHLIAGYR